MDMVTIFILIWWTTKMTVCHRFSKSANDTIIKSIWKNEKSAIAYFSTIWAAKGTNYTDNNNSTIDIKWVDSGSVYCSDSCFLGGGGREVLGVPFLRNFHIYAYANLSFLWHFIQILFIINVGLNYISKKWPLGHLLQLNVTNGFRDETRDIYSP